MCSCKHSLLMTGERTDIQVKLYKSGTKFKIKRLSCSTLLDQLWSIQETWMYRFDVVLTVYYVNVFMWPSSRFDLIESTWYDTIGSIWLDRVDLMWPSARSVLMESTWFDHRLDLSWWSRLDLTIGSIWSDRVDLKLIEFWRRYNFILIILVF